MSLDGPSAVSTTVVPHLAPEPFPQMKLSASKTLYEAIRDHNPRKVFALFSGGNDSTVLVAWAQMHLLGLLDAAVFVDTGTALPGVREFVEKFCADHDTPLLIYEAGDEYDRMVREHGFPGPSAHRFAYVRLKERQIDALVRDHKEGPRDRIMLLTGVRRAESTRRMGTTAPVKRDGAQVWVAPLIDWTNDDMRTYRETHRIEQSDVAALIHRSGECNCFSGDQRYVTRTGVQTFAGTFGTTQEVLTRKGWMKAQIAAFGIQSLQAVTFAPNQRGASRNVRRRVAVTPDHRWLLRDGGWTESLAVGDLVPATVAPVDEESDLYNLGYTHGLTFGDGHLVKKVAAGYRHLIPLFGRSGQARHRFDHVRDYPSRMDIPSYAGTATVYADRNLKEGVPPETDANYLGGFMAGWLLADGDLSRNGHWRLRSTDRDALDWAENIAPLAGLAVVGKGEEANTETNYGSRANRMGWLVLRPDLRGWKVTSIEPLAPEPVYCAVVPGEHEFALADGILTHNCGAYAAPGEREELRSLWPEWWAERMAPLEEATGCVWGQRRDETPSEAGPMCSDCQLRLAA